MDNKKLEISGKTSSSENTPASYKPIPEKDMEDDALSRPKSLVKEKVSLVEDGADEKMLTDDKVPEVVVYGNEKSPQNGDAKLDIVDAKSAFVGMTKEELLKYANDPFWVRLRWFLFITFWALWAAMLIGAIMIIYAAPKCDPPPPRTWWQEGPLSELKSDSNTESIPLVDKKIKAIIISSSAEPYSPLEEQSNILNLINVAKQHGTNVILEVDPTASKIWFEKSESKDPEYDNYYIWRAGTSGDSNISPPNNWISPKNISSWKYSNKRNEFYYSPFEKPHLNFSNKAVVQEFSKVIERFVVANVSGIRLRNARFLLVDSNFENEEPINSHASVGHNQYGFFKHTKTENLADLGRLLKEWRTVIRNKTEDGPLMLAEELKEVGSYKVNNTLIVDLPLKSEIFSKTTLLVNDTAQALNHTFNVEKIDWPLWKANTSAVPKDVLDVITYLLPGAPLISENENVNTALLKIRESPSIMRGICGVYNLNNNTVLAFIRVTPGSPGILVTVNPTDEKATVNIPRDIHLLSKLQEVTVRYYTSNYNETSFMDLNGKREASSVPVSPKSALILEYVPKKDE